MDDYSVNSLTESKNEWCARLVSILTPAIVQGLKSIFDEALQLCDDNDELDKYLITFQTFLSRVPKWNNEIIETERKRISEVSSCNYLEDLIACVHIIQLKALTCIRVGQEQKKIDIAIPEINTFVHKVYINVARKVYTNVYLFEKEIPPLQIQKHNRELEIIIKESILNTIRDTMPVEAILKAYMADTEETEVDVKEEIIEKPAPELPAPTTDTPKNGVDSNGDAITESKADTRGADTRGADTSGADTDTELPEIKLEPISLDDLSTSKNTTSVATSPLSFSDIDTAVDTTGKKEEIVAPKSIERLEKISQEANEKRKQEEAEEEEDVLKIGDEIKIELDDITLF